MQWIVALCFASMSFCSPIGAINDKILPSFDSVRPCEEFAKKFVLSLYGPGFVVKCVPREKDD